MKIVISNQELENIRNFVFWKIQNPNPCEKCSDSDRIACLGCPEEQEWINIRDSIPGYELCVNPGVAELAAAMEEEMQLSMKIQKLSSKYLSVRENYLRILENYTIEE